MELPRFVGNLNGCILKVYCFSKNNMNFIHPFENSQKLTKNLSANDLFNSIEISSAFSEPCFHGCAKFFICWFPDSCWAVLQENFKNYWLKNLGSIQKFLTANESRWMHVNKATYCASQSSFLMLNGAFEKNSVTLARSLIRLFWQWSKASFNGCFQNSTSFVTYLSIILKNASLSTVLSFTSFMSLKIVCETF